MELQEIEAVLERIWDLHDKLSDAIHAISRSHFLSSIQSLKKSDDAFVPRAGKGDKGDFGGGADERSGFVFVKEFRLEDDAAIAEARSLNAIRTALENLEDQLEFFHTVQSQQQAERDAALARLEQSRIVLAMRLADYHGKKYKVLEEAIAFVGDVQNSSRYVTPENLFEMPNGQGDELGTREIKRSNAVIQLFASGFNFLKKSLKLDQAGGVIGHATLVAVGMVALLQLHGVVCKGSFVPEKNGKRPSHMLEGSSSSNHLKHLDVLSARG